MAASIPRPALPRPLSLLANSPTNAGIAAADMQRERNSCARPLCSRASPTDSSLRLEKVRRPEMPQWEDMTPEQKLDALRKLLEDNVTIVQSRLGRLSDQVTKLGIHVLDEIEKLQKGNKPAKKRKPAGKRQ
jgi:hypothetical protein